MLQLKNKLDYNKKLKVYLDTTVVSYLLQPDAPEKMDITLKLWEKFKTGVYDICLSQVTLTETNRCNEEKLNYILEKLSEIEYTTYQITDEIRQLAHEVIESGILSEKSYDDCTHIAAAVINKCDVLVSWNFRHMVNIKTIQGVRTITNLKGYSAIDLITPETLLYMEE